MSEQINQGLENLPESLRISGNPEGMDDISHSDYSQIRREQMHAEASFPLEYSYTPEGQRYLSRGADGIVYDGPDDLIGMYDF